MEYDTDTTVNEEEIDALGIKKKDDSLIDVDDPDVDAVADTSVDPGLLEGEEKEDTDRGFFLEDKEYEQQLLDPYGDNEIYS